MTLLSFQIGHQPNDTTCGPTCLHAIYRYHGLDIGLDRVIDEVSALDRGGTLASMLACHALAQGFQAELHTFNVRVFDPSWFELGPREMRRKLRSQSRLRSKTKLRTACAAYLEFLDRGGQLRFADLSPRLIRHLLARGPVVTGLSATWLYHAQRERPDDNEEDDLGGEPVGHFVVLHGFDETRRRVHVADPMRDNPISPETPVYPVPLDRLTTAILLGVLTYDANLLLIEPPPTGLPGAGETP